jgi:hypothetical protein
MNVETADNLRKNFARRAAEAIDAAEAGGAIDKEAAEKARQIMGFSS